MSGLIAQVNRSVSARRLLQPGQKILVAVSGGLDSMVLLHVLRHLTSENQREIAVAHFNHQLRGRESDADEQFVRDRAGELGLPFFSERGATTQTMAAHGWSLEMAARRLRHDFLARTAASEQAVVALAHHADDQVELFFLRLLRGASMTGLAGMSWSSPSPANPRILLIRPLLDQNKEALRQFAVTEGIPFREDRSNLDESLARNRLRRDLLPHLRARYQPALDKIILRQMELIVADEAFLHEAALKVLAGPECGEFKVLPLALQRRVLRIQILQAGIQPDFDLIEQLRLHPGHPVSVAPGLRLLRESSGRVEVLSDVTDTFDTAARTLRLDGPQGESLFGGLAVHWTVQPADQIPRRKAPACEWFDADKVGSLVHLRHWQAGDRFQPIGSAHSVKLQDLFTNSKIPRLQRHRAVIAVTEQGLLWWVEGLRMAEHFKVGATTTRHLCWQWNRETELCPGPE